MSPVPRGMSPIPRGMSPVPRGRGMSPVPDPTWDVPPIPLRLSSLRRRRGAVDVGGVVAARPRPSWKGRGRETWGASARAPRGMAGTWGACPPCDRGGHGGHLRAPGGGCAVPHPAAALESLFLLGSRIAECRLHGGLRMWSQRVGLVDWERPRPRDMECIRGIWRVYAGYGGYTRVMEGVSGRDRGTTERAASTARRGRNGSESEASNPAAFRDRCQSVAVLPM